EVPAEVREPLRLDRLTGEPALGDGRAGRLDRGYVAEVEKPGDHVGDLDARVVEVVLDLDLEAEAPQGAHEDVAEDRVAQVADVRGLVGIDVRVLDDDLLAAGRHARRAAEQRADERSAVEEEIEVPGAFDARLAYARGKPEGPGEICGDRPRRFLQRL